MTELSYEEALAQFVGVFSENCDELEEPAASNLSSIATLAKILSSRLLGIAKPERKLHRVLELQVKIGARKLMEIVNEQTFHLGSVEHDQETVSFSCHPRAFELFFPDYRLEDVFEVIASNLPTILRARGIDTPVTYYRVIEAVADSTVLEDLPAANSSWPIFELVEGSIDKV